MHSKFKYLAKIVHIRSWTIPYIPVAMYKSRHSNRHRPTKTTTMKKPRSVFILLHRTTFYRMQIFYYGKRKEMRRKGNSIPLTSCTSFSFRFSFQSLEWLDYVLLIGCCVFSLDWISTVFCDENTLRHARKQNSYSLNSHKPSCRQFGTVDNYKWLLAFTLLH